MNTQELRIDSSPRAIARIEGVLYLIIIVLGIFVEVGVRGRIFVGGDPAATAANLRSMERLWRVGIAAELVMVVCTIASALLLYVLLRPVSRDLALLATMFGLTGGAVEASYALRLFDALLPLGRAAYLNSFSAEQLHAMVTLTLRSHSYGFGVVLFLFGPAFLVLGFLISRSGYFPKALGIIYMLPGFAYMTNSVALMLAPHAAGRVFTLIAGPAFFGEASLCLWLLIKGLDVEAWNRRRLPDVAGPHSGRVPQGSL